MKQKLLFDKESSTALKGIAIIMMLFHHCFRKTFLFEEYTISFFPLSQQTVVNLAFVSKICVSIFAFISGYGLYLGYDKYSTTSHSNGADNSAGRWVLSRYVKTFTVYWLVWIIWAVLSQLLNGEFTRVLFCDGAYNGVVYSLLNFMGLSQLFETPTLNNDWWYMSAAAVYIVVIPFVYKYRKELPLLLVVIIAFPRVIFGGRGISVFPGWSTVYSFMSPFLIGCIFAHSNVFALIIKSNGKKSKTIRLALEIWLIFIGYRLFYRTAIESFWEIHYGLFPLLIILFLVEFVIPMPLINKALRIVGKHATGIYLVHGFYRTYYLPDFIYSFQNCWIIVFVLLLCSLGTSIVLDLLMNIFRHRDFLERLSGRY